MKTHISNYVCIFGVGVCVCVYEMYATILVKNMELYDSGHLCECMERELYIYIYIIQT